ncbi:DsbA family oxidoreductase [Ahrensia sp. R2A130]|uniref:DsbA family oxidoreductase n=1 Tax=Ahrensia sp. R2A130 TaxID=744979 RepID=UPI0001E0E04D|nr:DsbA family oxidoreductase [Ahrensia sp. R2A130]EFL90344.1 thiol oxidoreductase FrnE [Ahrensia sp. R2A130]
MSAQNPTSKIVSIDVVSDVMCPWCLIGKRRLEEALGKLDDSISTEVRWRPYQLDATLPPEGKDRTKYLEDKFGGPERAQQIYSSIEEAGRAEGIDFKFSDIAVSPNTLDAHRLIRWAQNEGGDVQNLLVERLFQMFFLEGANIGKHDVLLEAAEHAGMDTAIVASLLPTEKDRAEVQEEIATAQQMGVTGVPCFIIDQKYAVMGAQAADTLVQAITDATKQPAD